MSKSKKNNRNKNKKLRRVNKPLKKHDYEQAVCDVGYGDFIAFKRGEELKNFIVHSGDAGFDFKGALSMFSCEEKFSDRKPSDVFNEEVNTLMSIFMDMPTSNDKLLRDVIGLSNSKAAHLIKASYKRTLPDSANQSSWAMVFELLAEGGVRAELAEIMQDDRRCILPDEVREYYREWDAKTAPAEKLEIDDSASPEDAPAADEQTVFVNGDFIAYNPAGEDMLPLEGVDHDPAQKERIPVLKIEAIKAGIRNYFELDGAITTYVTRGSQEVDADQDFSLKVIEFTEKGGRTHQIAVNDWYGGLTSVIKPAVFINIDAPELVDVAVLRQQGKAFNYRCMISDATKNSPVKRPHDNYVQRLMEVCRKDVSEMEPQRERVGWRDKKAGLMNSLYEYVRATGQKPKTNNDNLIGFGHLRGFAAWSRANSALSSGTIVGLEGVKNFDQLIDYMVDHGYPDVKEHMNKPAISAKRLFDEAVEIIKKDGIVPQSEMLGLYELCGRADSEISSYFQCSTEAGVHNVEAVIDLTKVGWPNNLDDFMVASGAAYREDGMLCPNYEHLALRDHQVCVPA